MIGGTPPSGRTDLLLSPDARGSVPTLGLAEFAYHANHARDGQRRCESRLPAPNRRKRPSGRYRATSGAHPGVLWRSRAHVRIQRCESQRPNRTIAERSDIVVRSFLMDRVTCPVLTGRGFFFLHPVTFEKLSAIASTTGSHRVRHGVSGRGQSRRGVHVSAGRMPARPEPQLPSGGTFCLQTVDSRDPRV